MMTKKNFSQSAFASEELTGSRLTSFWQEGKITTDILEFPESYRIYAELSGFTKEEISLQYADKILTITATKNNQLPENQTGRYLRKERSSRQLLRRFELPEVAVNNISATLANGLLEIVLPKISQTALTKRSIPIE